MSCKMNRWSIPARVTGVKGNELAEQTNAGEQILTHNQLFGLDSMRTCQLARTAHQDLPGIADVPDSLLLHDLHVLAGACFYDQRPPGATERQHPRNSAHKYNHPYPETSPGSSNGCSCSLSKPLAEKCVFQPVAAGTSSNSPAPLSSSTFARRTNVLKSFPPGTYPTSPTWNACGGTKLLFHETPCVRARIATVRMAASDGGSASSSSSSARISLRRSEATETASSLGRMERTRRPRWLILRCAAGLAAVARQNVGAGSVLSAARRLTACVCIERLARQPSVR